MKNWKKLLALGLSLSMALTLAACGGGSSSGSGSGGSTTAATQAAETTTADAATQPSAVEVDVKEEDYPDLVTEPITIEIWHCSGAGANGDYMDAAIAEFNETNEYGITVEGTYQGGYGDILAKTTTAIAAGETPELVVMSATGISSLGEKGILADLTGYVARDGIDMDNFAGGMTDFAYYGDQIISFPFNRSTALFFYNKDIWDEMGFEVPTKYEDLLTMAKEITAKHPDMYGFGMYFSEFFLQEALVRSLGSDGFTTADGQGPDALDDGSMLRLLTDWRQGVDEGYIVPTPTTSAEGTLKDMMYQKQLASSFFSCGGLKNLLKYSAEANMNMGVALMPAYGGPGSNGGGANMAAIGKDKSQQQIAAAWEFIKFIIGDEQSAKRAKDTGYLPITFSCTETDTIQTLWKEQPEYKIAFDQLEYCRDTNWTLYQSEWGTYLKQAMSYVTQDLTMTPEEGVAYLEEQAKIVFPNYGK